MLSQLMILPFLIMRTNSENLNGDLNLTPRTTYGKIGEGSVRVILSCWVMLTSIFSLPEEFGSVEVADELKIQLRLGHKRASIPATFET